MAFSRSGGGGGATVDRDHSEPPPTDDYGCDSYAASLSPFDINAAITRLGSEGGTVCLPAGTGTFNPPWNGVGVTIPYLTHPLTIRGQGAGVTVLQETVNSGTSTMFQRERAFPGYSAAALRLTGITFKGYVVDEAVSNNIGVDIRNTIDFRIDHCNFEDFVNIGFYTDADTGDTAKLINRGLVDHCGFDNPYKDNWLPHNPAAPSWAVWGYGIIVRGTCHTNSWDPDIDHYLGHYYPFTTYAGFDIPAPIYVEDCTFSRCRHAISSNGGGYYVSRHNIFSKCSPYGQHDMHGNTPGGRGFECYDNILDFSDESYSLGQDCSHEPRGGSGVITDEDVTLNLAYPTNTVGMQSDGEAAPYNINHLYIWDNTAQDTLANPLIFNNYNDYDGYTEDVDYYLRAPTVLDDGFVFTKYTYPHPLNV